jgi:hypothetical protein
MPFYPLLELDEFKIQTIKPTLNSALAAIGIPVEEFNNWWLNNRWLDSAGLLGD